MARDFILILGGARSGKSNFAQNLAERIGGQALFVATAEPLDEEMRQRIDEHRSHRPQGWRTLEVKSNIAMELCRELANTRVVLLDCITLLVSNLLLSGRGDQVDEEIGELIKCLDKWSGIFIAVSNEVGLGLVPESEISRKYRDLLGKANQILVQQANQVYFMVSGIPIKIKG